MHKHIPIYSNPFFSKWILLAWLLSISPTLLRRVDLIHRGIYTPHDRVAKFVLHSMYRRTSLLEVETIDQPYSYLLFFCIWSLGLIVANKISTSYIKPAVTLNGGGETKVACDLCAQLFLYPIDMIANASRLDVGHTSLYHTSNNSAVIPETSSMLPDSNLVWELLVGEQYAINYGSRGRRERKSEK